MQQFSLTLDKFVDHAAKWHTASTVATASRGTILRRAGYAELRSRSNLLSGALRSLGLGTGDRVGTLAWNTQHHLELHYATMNAGMVCHTLNPRLTAAHLSAMIKEAADRILAIAANLAGILPELLPLCPTIERVIVLDEEAEPSLAGRCDVPVEGIDALLAARGAAVRWGEFDEASAAGLCFTSGTTGRPKGVQFTHRSNYLHTMMSIQPDAYCLSARDRILLAIPMFHANAWGLPFSAPAVGASLVLPGRELDGASLASLIRSEEVTIAGGVQTVWIGLLDHLDATGGEVPSLERVIIGGSKCPDALIRRMEERLGARVQTTWGMTEMSPLGTVDSIQFPPSAERSSGRPPMGVDLKLTDAEGATLPEQRGVVGHLKVKGHSVIDRYLNAAASALDREGYFDTGDLATISEDGALTICGRSKDLIKSGGEWINPAEMESIVGRDPRVAQVAVIGKPHPKWGERPVLVVELRNGEAGDARALVDALRGRVADWWLPDEIVQIPRMPVAATGKIDKVRLRADYQQGELDGFVLGRYSRIGVVGAGLMGAEIALTFALSGMDVLLNDRDPAALETALGRLGALLERGVSRGFYTEDQGSAALERIRPAPDLAAFADRGLVTEAVFESLEVKSKVLVALDAVCSAECVIATNTSTLPVSTLAAALSPERRPRFLGTHYFSPVSRMSLVEIVPGFDTDPGIVDWTVSILEQAGKQPITVKDVAGFAVNRMLHAMLIEAVRLVEEGVATPEDLDTACRLGLGHPIGPFALMDNVTSSLCLQVQEILQENYGERFRPPALLKQRVAAGYAGGFGKPGWLRKA